MKRAIISCVLAILCYTSGMGQSEPTSQKGSVTLHLGTVAIYHTFSLGYETPDFLSQIAKHGLMARAGLGGWHTNLFRANTGLQSHFEVTYLRGTGKHHLELASGIVFHFDRGLKEQFLTHVGTLYRPFVGYRYQAPDKRISFRVGTGWREVLQIGLNFRL